MSHSPQRTRPSTGKSGLNRRWSLDSSVSTPSEGYLKDLRRQHQIQRQASLNVRNEAYPFMLTEIRRSAPTQDRNRRIGSFDEEAVGRRSPMRSPPNRSLFAKFSSSSSSIDVSSVTVPEEQELCQTFDQATSLKPFPHDPRDAMKAFARQRSSSLPRLLPPIFDEDTTKACSSTSSPIHNDYGKPGRRVKVLNVILREMQKFACQNAQDVHYLLPLPVPANPAAAAKKTADEDILPAAALEFKHFELVFNDIAKLHALSYGMRKVHPLQFDELVSHIKLREKFFSETELTLRLRRIRPHLVRFVGEVMSRREGVHPNSEVVRAECDKIVADLHELRATEKDLVAFCHGDLCLRNILFRHENKSTPLGVKFADFSRSFVGSPLADLYTFLFTATTAEFRSHYQHRLMETYYQSFTRCLKDLNILVNFVSSFEEFYTEFRRQFLAGVVMTCALTTTHSHAAEEEKQHISNHEDIDDFFDKHIDEVLDIGS